MNRPIESLRNARRDIVAGTRICTTQPCSEEKHWIEIVLEDDRGNPVPEEEYLVTTADDTEYSGVLDSRGRARIEGIKADDYEVTFPRIHKTEWQKK
jgi:hypothetical protein